MSVEQMQLATPVVPVPRNLSEFMADRGLPPGGLAENLQLAITAASAERTTGTMPVAHNTQPYGYLHGGASIALGETVASIAAMMSCADGEVAVGKEVIARHRRPVSSGSVNAVAELVESDAGNRRYEVIVSDEDGHVTTEMTIRCAVRKLPDLAGRKLAGFDSVGPAGGRR